MEKAGKNCHELWQEAARHATKLVESFPADLQGRTS